MTAVYDLLGFRVAVTVSGADVDRVCHSVLANFATDVRAPGTPVQSYALFGADDGWHVESDGKRLYSGADPRDAVAALEGRLVIEAVKRRPDLFHVHGAALALPGLDGAVVLAGAAGVGKTTLARALMERRFLPYGDDVTLIDSASLEVQSFPRAFHLRESGGGEGHVRDRLPTYFHPPRWAPTPLPVRLILFLSRGAEGGPRATRLAHAEAAGLLLGHSGSLAAAPAPALAVAVRAIAQARCYRFELGRPPASAAAVDALWAELRSRPPEPIARRT